MKATFENSVNVLVKAYLNDTLEHANCYACAIGNLVAAANNKTYTKCTDSTYLKLALLENDGRYYTEKLGGNWYDVVIPLQPDPNSKLALIEIDSIGYSVVQVIRIERAFEGASKHGDRMFNGLMDVVDVLAEIHGVDLSIKESAKAMFVKAI